MKNILAIWQLSGLVLSWCFFHATRHVLGHEALKNGWYIVIKACKFTISRLFCIIIYCVSVLFLYIESTDSIILIFFTTCSYEWSTNITTPSRSVSCTDPNIWFWYRISSWWWSYVWVLLSFHRQPLLECSPWLLLAV